MKAFSTAISRKLFLLSCLGAVCFGAVLSSAAPALGGDPFTFLGNWNYRKTGGDTGDSSLFNHTYTLIYSKELTQAMSFSGAVRYNENAPSGTQRKTDSINPSVSLDARNELFNLNLSASQTKFNREGSSSRTSQAWNAIFNSQVKNWPALRLFYSQSQNYDDGSPREQDVDSQVLGVTIEYSVANLEFLYDVRNTQSEDRVNRTDSETTDQTGQIEYTDSFFGNRVSLAVSQQYQTFDTTTETRVGVGGQFFVPALPLAAFAGEDDTPLTGLLPANPALIDGNVVTPAGIDLAGSLDAQNMAVQMDFQPVSRFRVILDQEIDAAIESRLSWSVYQSADGINWDPVSGVLAPSYDLENGQSVALIDLESPIESRYVKLVSRVSLPSVNPVFVTEMEAGELRTATSDRATVEQRTVTLQSQFSTTVRITNSWQVSYNMRRNETRPDSGQDTTRFNHTLNTRYTPSHLLTLSLGASESIDWVDDERDRRSRSYYISAGSAPLPSMNLTLGYTRTETENENNGDTNSDSISGLINARIFPSLTSNIAMNWTRSEDVADESSNTAYGINMDATARLSPRLDLNVNAGYSESTSEEQEIEGETVTGTRYGFTLGYRPSDILLFNGSYSRQVEDGTSTLSGSFTGLWSRSLQTIFGLTYQMGDQDSQQYNGTISWLLNRRLSGQINGSYLSAESGNSWSLLTSMHLTL